MSVSVGQVALDIVMGRETISSTINSAVSEATRTVTDSSATMTAKLGAVGTACSNVGAAMMPVSAAIAGMGVAGVLAADQMDEAVNQYIASTGKSVKETEKYEDVLKSIHKANYGEDYYDIANAMATVNQQMGDLSDDELKKTTESAIALRDTFEYDVNESVRSAQMMMDQFGISSEEAFNLMVQGAQNGLDKNGDLLDTINEYSVHFEQLGFSADQMFNMLANGAEAGTFSVDKLGDAVKEFGIRVKDGSDSSRAAFEYLGYDADALFQTFNEGGAEAAAMTQILIDELAGMPDSVEKTTAGVALFGTMWEDLGDKGLQALSELEGGIDRTKASMEELKEVKYDNLMADLEGLKRTFIDDVAVPVGEILIPILSDLVDAITPAIEAFGNMSPEMQKAIVAGMALVAAIGPILTTIGSVISAVTTIGGAISGLSGLFAGAGAAAGAAGAGAGVLGGALTALSGPVGWVIAGIAAVVAGGVALYKNWDTVKEKAGQLKDWTVTKFGELKEGAVEKFTTLKDSVSEKVSSFCGLIQEKYGGTISGAQGLFTTFKDFTGNIFEQTKVAALGPVASMCQLISGDIDGAKQTAVDTLTRLKENGGEIMTGFKDLVGGATSTVSTFLKEHTAFGSEMAQKAFTNMKEGIGSTCGKIAGTVKDGFNAAIDYITALPGEALKWGSDIIDNIVSGIKGAIGKVQDAAADVAQSIRSFLHFTVPDEGPLADFNSYMPDMMSQLAGGMLGNLGQVESAAMKVAGTMANALTVPMPTPALANVGGYGQTVTNSRMTSAQTNNDNLVALIKALIDKLDPNNGGGGFGGGDIIVPVYVDGRIVDERVYKAEEIRNQRSGGRA